MSFDATIVAYDLTISVTILTSRINKKTARISTRIVEYFAWHKNGENWFEFYFWLKKWEKGRREKGKGGKNSVVESWNNLSILGVEKAVDNGKYAPLCKGSFCTLNVCLKIGKYIPTSSVGKRTETVLSS